MPSQIKRFTPTVVGSMPPSQTVDGFNPAVGVVAGNADSIAQVKVQTIDSSQTGRYGLRFGRAGQLVRINAQGEFYDIDGSDQTGGVTIEAMPENVNPQNTEPVIELFVAAPNPS